MSKNGESWIDPDATSDAMPLRQEGEPEDRFRKGGKYQDWPWTIVYLIQFVVVVAIGLHYFHIYHSTIVADTPNPTSQQAAYASINDNASLLILIIAGFSVLFGISYLMFVRKYTYEAVWAALIFGGLFIAGCLIYFCAVKRVVGIVIMAICLPLYIWYVYSIRDSIPFAVNVIRTCIKVMELWPSTVGVALVGVIFQYAWLVLWVVCTIGVFAAMNIKLGLGAKSVDSETGASLRSVITAKFVFVLFGMFLSYFWTQQLIKNIVHVTVSGTVAWWYFLFPQPVAQGAEPYQPVGPALKRALTTSLGSIVLASLVTAIVKAIRYTVQTLRSWLMSEETSCCTVAVMCITECMLRFIESLVEYVNQYALTYVAIYGYSYFDSAGRCYELMKKRGLDAVANDSLIDGVLFFGSFAGGVFGAVLGGVLFSSLKTGGDWKVWALIGFITAFVLTLTMLSVLESAVITLFVCLADDPAVLKNNKRDIYDLLVPTMQQQYEGVNLETIHSRAEGARNSYRGEKGHNQV